MSQMAIPHCHRRGHHWRRNLDRMLAFAERGETEGPRGPGRRGRHHHGPQHGPFPGRRGRGPRARRGDVRAAILLLLADEPRNGYALMQAIEERTGGVWRPSPGSVYPALALLEDEGLVLVEEREGGRAFRLTDAGTAYVEEHRVELAQRWDLVNDAIDDRVVELMQGMRQLGIAAGQLAHVGSRDQVAEAARIVEEARRSFYRMLAGDAPAPPSGDEPQA